MVFGIIELDRFVRKWEKRKEVKEGMALRIASTAIKIYRMTIRKQIN